MRQSETKCSNQSFPTGPARSSQPTQSTPPAGSPPAPPSAPPDPPSSGGPGDSRSTLPPSSERWIVFRESFLFYFDPDRREVLRRAGEEIFTQVLSGDLHRPEEPWTHARLRSLVLDLRWVVQYLEEVAAEPLESHPEDRDEDRLAREAARWAEEIAAVAGRIEEAVERRG